jgi:hypothetical protein
LGHELEGKSKGGSGAARNLISEKSSAQLGWVRIESVLFWLSFWVGVEKSKEDFTAIRIGKISCRVLLYLDVTSSTPIGGREGGFYEMRSTKI